MKIDKTFLLIMPHEELVVSDEALVVLGIGLVTFWQEISATIRKTNHVSS